MIFKTHPKMSLIFETSNFTVVAEELPLVSRLDGGHISISPKVRINDRTLLEPDLAVELMFLSMLIGEAMTVGLTNRGIPIGRINYQDNGNWAVFKPEGPYLHLHLYGRATNARIQKYGEACYFPFRETGFYDHFEPLNLEDVREIQAQIKLLLSTDKFQLSRWNSIQL